MNFYKENFPYYDKMYLYIEGQGTFLGRMLNDYPGKEFVKKSDDFSVALVFLATYLMLSDGNRSKEEYEFIEDYFTKFHRGNKRLGKAAAELARHIDATTKDYTDICETIKRYARKTGKLQLIDFLCELAFADATLDKKEHKNIQLIGFKIGLEKQEFITILNSHIAKRLKEQKKRRQKKKTSRRATGAKSRKASPRGLGMGMEMACKILGIPRNCTAAELKKAYRKMARLHHPDKVAYLGKEHVEQAAERFDQIADAYQYIKRIKGF